MPSPSVTYTFSNATTADANQVNTNFTDLVNSLTDGLKDITVSSVTSATLTVSGVASFNGAVNLGNATGDDITVTGYIASDLLPKTAGTASLGSSTQTWEDIYLDEGATNGGTIYFDAGTTKYIQSNAAGTILTIGGFTSMVPPAAINAAGALTIGTNGGTTAITVDSSQNVTLNAGNLVIGTSGKGIDFSADSSAAGMTSELLSDYEKGSWTPAITFGGGSNGIQYTARPATYTKIGDRVYCNCDVLLQNKGSSTGTARITGLPFTSNATTGNVGNIVATFYANGTSINYFIGGYVETNSTTGILLNGGTSSVSHLTDGNFQNTTELVLFISYPT